MFTDVPFGVLLICCWLCSSAQAQGIAAFSVITTFTGGSPLAYLANGFFVSA